MRSVTVVGSALAMTFIAFDAAGAQRDTAKKADTIAAKPRAASPRLLSCISTTLVPGTRLTIDGIAARVPLNGKLLVKAGSHRIRITESRLETTVSVSGSGCHEVVFPARRR